MRGKMTRLILVTTLFLLLTGCFAWSPEGFYQLPQAPADFKNLMEIIDQTKRELAARYSTTVEDVPPSVGDNTSTVQQLDLDGDGTLEAAVTFFRVVGAELPIRIYFYTRQPDESYAVSHVVEGEGSSVYAVHYAEMDGSQGPDGNNRKEVVVSWQMGTDAYYLGVYALNEKEVTAMTMTAYQSYQILDLDRDGRMELAVGHIDLEHQINSVDIYDWNDGRLEAVSQIPLSNGLTNIRAMKSNYLKGFVPALYVSGDLVDGSRTTDVIAVKDGEATNLSLDTQTWISRERVSVYRDIAANDVNSDYILELAHPYQLPAYGTGGTFWLIDWTQYGEDGQTQDVCTTYHNTTDGWYLLIPEHWRDKVTIYRNDSVSGQRTVIFALWQGEDKEPLPFMSIYKLTGASRSLRATSGNRFVLAEDSSTSTTYAATFYDTWDCGLDRSGLLENFRLIVSSWYGD